MEKGLKNEGLNLDEIPDPGNRFVLGDILGVGVDAKVYSAVDNESGGNVAVKVQKVTSESFYDLEEEYKILRDLSSHPNLPDFYGAYKTKEGDYDMIWFVMELCEGGPITDLVRALLRQAKKMSELHIAFVLKNALKALMSLHDNHIIHRDVKGSNILLTKNGEVKLVDFGLSRELSSTLGRRQTCLGSPCWMAPEVVTCKDANTTYDNRVDVWALGITAIELGDGKAPFQDMHPTRALFQIVRNPPPTLYRPANWSQHYNDFISECLVKNPEHRPYMAELVEHPFFEELPENDFHLNTELKCLLEKVTAEDIAERKPEMKVKGNRVKSGKTERPEPMYVEDLAGLDLISEDNIMKHLEARYQRKQFYTYVGDVLLFLNPNQEQDIYGFQHYSKYKCKSRSENAPHIYAVADSAYQDMLHHDTPQNIVLAGETMSGKTTQCKYLVKHLLNLGMNKCGEKVQKAIDLIHSFGNASTPVNPNSTRHALITQITFSSTGKVSGGIFWLHQLEKWRVTGNRNPYHANFHIFYYMYDGLSATDGLEKYNLEPRNFCYLRREVDDSDKDPNVPVGPREDVENNVKWFNRVKNILTDLDFDDNEKDVIWRTLAAVLLLGEVEYKEDDDGNADIKENTIVDKTAELLCIDSKKLGWALCNYCVVEKDTVARRRHSRPEALEARNVLAQAIYTRLVDWIINIINMKLSFARAVYGDHHCVSIMDMFGFECYQDNGLEQLFINSLNEQLQYFYNQKIFISGMQEEIEDDVHTTNLQFYDNKDTMDEILNKPKGIMHVLDEANKLHLDEDFIIDCLKKNKHDGSHVRVVNDEQFSVAHYTGKVTYEAVTMCSKNRDFLPPELTEVMRLSTDSVVKQLFSNKLSRTGNLTIIADNAPRRTDPGKKKWSVALMSDSTRNIRRYNTASRGEFSQTRGIRTAAAIFRATSLELLRLLANGGTHFVRCIRTDLNATPSGFQPNIIRQQLRALAVADTARARQIGYSYRIPFDQFLNRYQFLAFDFDETVEHNKDNCRLLLIRLKLEGWKMGNTKVFLKYYNEEFLSRLYETQVKKIVKVQSMLRSFLAKRNTLMKKKSMDRQKSTTSQTAISVSSMTQEEAATVIQKHAKGYVARKKHGTFNPLAKLDNDTAVLIKGYFKKWKTRSLFQVLMLHKAVKHQEMIYFSQQVHLYCQNAVGCFINNQDTSIDLKSLDLEENELFIGPSLPTVWKIPFNIKDMPYCDSSHMVGSIYDNQIKRDEIPWDAPFQSLNKACQTSLEDDGKLIGKKKGHGAQITTPYTRDPQNAEKNYVSQPYEEEVEMEAPKVAKMQNINKNTAKISHLNSRNNSTNNQKSRPLNPVFNELQLRGAAIQTNNNEDDPPFNFQAMLRKTNNKRISMKGNDNDERNNNVPANNNRKYEKNKSYENTREMIASTKNYGSNTKNMFQNGLELERTEILPGFFVLGSVTEL